MEIKKEKVTRSKEREKERETNKQKSRMKKKKKEKKKSQILTNCKIDYSKKILLYSLFRFFCFHSPFIHCLFRFIRHINILYSI